MKRLIVIFVFLITFSCQTDDQIVPKSSENLTAASAEEIPDEKKGLTNARVGPPRLWSFYRGGSTSNLRYAYSDDGTTWSGDQIFNNGIGSSTSPAVVFRFLDKFYAIYKGGSSFNIYFSSSTDGMNWQPNTQIPGISTAFAPSAVVANDRIYVFFVSDWLIYYISSTDGTNWSTKKLVPYSVCNGAVTAYSDGSYITLFHNYPSSDGGFYLLFSDAYAWGENLAFSNASNIRNTSGKAIQTTTGVGVTKGPDGYWYVAYKHPDGGRLNIYRGSCLGGTGCGGGTVYWSNAYTSNGPSLQYFNNKYMLLYKAVSSSAILYGRSSDGMSWSSNHAALGQTTNGGPRLVVEY